MSARTDSQSLRITHLRLRNWRNFKNVDIDLSQRCFVFGPNASGKSNFLDAFRFLRDLAVDPGGLQYAVRSRGGMGRVRSLASRNNNKGGITVGVAIGTDLVPKKWEYELTFSAEKSGLKRPVVIEEVVKKEGCAVLLRRGAEEGDDEALTQSRIEQVTQNKEFREIAEFFGTISYLHLVPQVIRDPRRSAENADDPYGGDFIAHIARTPKRDRERRLRVINASLQLAVPQLADLQQTQDIDGQPHLQARYKHWRSASAYQNEKDFSDGTLRLIGFLWSLQEKSGVALLEEPELSLHEEVVRQLPAMISRATRTSRQVISTTHSWAILEDEGLGLNEVIVLSTSGEGTTACPVSELSVVVSLVNSGVSLRDSLHADLIPKTIRQLQFVDLG